MPQDVAAVLAAAFAGPPALPYAADFRFLLQQHLTELVQVRGQAGRRSVTPGHSLGLLAAAAAYPCCRLGHSAGPALAAHQDA